MNYEWELEQLENTFRQELRDFSKFREENNKRYNAAPTIEEKAKIDAQLEDARKSIRQSQDERRAALKTEYSAYLKSQEELRKSEKSIENEKMYKKLLPDYAEREAASNPEELKEIEEKKLKDALKEKEDEQER